MLVQNARKPIHAGLLVSCITGKELLPYQKAVPRATIRHSKNITTPSMMNSRFRRCSRRERLGLCVPLFRMIFVSLPVKSTRPITQSVLRRMQPLSRTLVKSNAAGTGPVAQPSPWARMVPPTPFRSFSAAVHCTVAENWRSLKHSMGQRPDPSAKGCSLRQLNLCFRLVSPSKEEVSTKHVNPLLQNKTKTSAGMASSLAILTTLPTRMSFQCVGSSLQSFKRTLRRPLTSWSARWRLQSSYRSFAAVQPSTKTSGSTPTSFPKTSRTQLSTTIKRKKKFASRWNCSNRFSGRNVSTVYFVVRTLLEQKCPPSLGRSEKHLAVTFRGNSVDTLQKLALGRYFPVIAQQHNPKNKTAASEKM
eukprot:RCo018710